jgi:hypothetical protein
MFFKFTQTDSQPPRLTVGQGWMSSLLMAHFLAPVDPHARVSILIGFIGFA